jgi:hypothetical protein
MVDLTVRGGVEKGGGADVDGVDVAARVSLELIGF